MPHGNVSSVYRIFLFPLIFEGVVNGVPDVQRFSLTVLIVLHATAKDALVLVELPSAKQPVVLINNIEMKTVVVGSFNTEDSGMLLLKVKKE